MSDEQKEPGHLVKAAQEMGAETISTETKDFNETPGLKERLGDGKVNFFADLPKENWPDLLGQAFIIRAIKIIQGWDTYFGTSDFPLIMAENPDGTRFTTLGSGKAILNQCKKLNKDRKLPVKVTLSQRHGNEGLYYILE